MKTAPLLLLGLAVALISTLGGCLPGEFTDAELKNYAAQQNKDTAAGEPDTKPPPCDPEDPDQNCCFGGVIDCYNNTVMTCRHPECVDNLCVPHGKPKAPGSPCPWNIDDPDSGVCAGPQNVEKHPEFAIGDCMPKFEPDPH